MPPPAGSSEPICSHAWTTFALAATISQWALQRLAFLDPMMAASSAIVGAGALLLAGIYQLTPLKRACLINCQSPLAFIAGRGGFGTGSASALKLGAEHGLYCVGCCWALMALLFFGGVMNPVWIAALAAFVLTEKLVPGPWLSWCLGVLLIVWACRSWCYNATKLDTPEGENRFRQLPTER
ncbi:DUF2182 domain-containing protein [Mesorhizobium wenxiniae]|uniref:DUF2182 domain-containing protein n=1 Tax=Mesorhizobium wenxiniae TaxID=2014805 RepID=UPI001FDAC5C0|nr:DUF2182 domain-containing protein [Mesorhizobium wenxiniae]